MVILGGTGNVWGVMFGGLLIQSFDRIFAERLTGWVHKFGAATGVPAVATLLSNFDLLRSRLFIFGLCLVLLMALRPQGLLPARKRRESALIDETEEEANARHDAAVAQAGGPQ